MSRVHVKVQHAPKRRLLARKFEASKKVLCGLTALLIVVVGSSVVRNAKLLIKPSGDTATPQTGAADRRTILEKTELPASCMLEHHLKGPIRLGSESRLNNHLNYLNNRLHRQQPTPPSRLDLSRQLACPAPPMPREEPEARKDHIELYKSRVCSFDQVRLLEPHLGRKGVVDGAMTDLVNAPPVKCAADWFVTTTKLRPGDVVLDWGAGCGALGGYLKSRYALKIIGVDLGAESISFAEKKGLLDKGCAADGRNLTWIPSSSVNAVISTLSLGYLSNDEKCDLMREHVIRILRPGGCSFFTMLNGELKGVKKFPVADPPNFWHKCLRKEEALGFFVDVLSNEEIFGTKRFSQLLERPGRNFGYKGPSLYELKRREVGVTPHTSEAFDLWRSVVEHARSKLEEGKSRQYSLLVCKSYDPDST